MCQDILFSNIRESHVTFPEEQWAGISCEAKDLIRKLLEKDSSRRLTAEEVLSHPWITSEGSTLVLHTPRVLNKHQESLRNLEEFANKIMEVNRSMEPASTAPINPSNTEPVDIPSGRRPAMSFNLSPVDFSNCNLLQRRRRKSKELFSKFLSIDELETDFFMKAIS